MSYLKTLLLLLLIPIMGSCQVPDSSYAVIKGEVWELKVHPDSLSSSVSILQGPRKSYNVNTGSMYLLNIVDSSWAEFAIVPDFIGAGGIYSGSGTVSSPTTINIGGNLLDFQNGDDYFKLYADKFRIGKDPDPMFGGGYETEFTETGVNASSGNGVGQFTITANTTDLRTEEGLITMTLDRQEEVTYRTDVAGLEYLNFPNWNGLTNNSLTPKGYVDTEISNSTSVVTGLSITSGTNLAISQSNAPTVSTNLGQYIGADLRATDPFGSNTPKYPGKFHIDTLGVDSVYISIGTTTTDWLLIHP